MGWTREMTIVSEAVQKAGEAVLHIARDTTADLEANRILKKALLENFPEDGWLSEETRDDLQRLAKKRLWVVDPIDGTKEFIRGLPEFSVSVALVEDGQPVIAAVYNPSTGEMFSAVRGEGSWLNGKPVRSDHVFTGRPVIVVSRTDAERGEFMLCEPHAEIRPVGSIAYKLALIAAGRADAVVSLSPKNEWDIAAGVLLVEEAGGRVTDREGRPFVFNRAKTLVNGVIAATARAYDHVRALIQAWTG